MKPSYSFVALDKSVHDRNAFDCGEAELNQFFQQHAARHHSRLLIKCISDPPFRLGHLVVLHPGEVALAFSR